MDIQALQRFALPGQLAIIEGEGGLPFVQIKNSAATAEICLLGAHVTSYIPEGGADVLWVSKKAEFAVGKAIRGGVPICWPWFGPAPAGATTAHGYVRFMLWEIASTRAVSADCTEVVFRTSSAAEAPAIWQKSFELTFTVRVGSTLEMELSTKNTGTESFTINQALHTYYNVSDIEKIQITGFAGQPYFDKVVGNTQPNKVQNGPITFSAEMDAVFEQADGSAEILDPGYNRRILIAKENSGSSVVWNPWIAKTKTIADMDNEEYRTMVCVENCNIRSDEKTILPGGTHTLKAKVQVLPLG